MADEHPLQTSTPTVSKTKTNLAVAVLALAAAGGIAAFAFIPSMKKMDKSAEMNNMPVALKCGVNSYSVMSKCNTGYLQAKYECYDGTSGVVGDPKTCQSSAELSQLAGAVCQDMCNQPAPVALPSIQIDNEIRHITNRYYLAGTHNFAAGHNVHPAGVDVMINELQYSVSTTMAIADLQNTSFCVETIGDNGRLVELGCEIANVNRELHFTNLGLDLTNDDSIIVTMETPYTGPQAGNLAASGQEITLLLQSVEALHMGSGELLVAPNQNGITEPGEYVFDTDDDGRYDERGDHVALGDDQVIVASKPYELRWMDLQRNLLGIPVDTEINGTGQYTFGVIEVTQFTHFNDTAAGDRAQMALSDILVKLDTTHPSTTIENVTIERALGFAGPVPLVYDRHSEGYRGTNIDQLMGDDAKMDSGSTEYFIVRGTITSLYPGIDSPDMILPIIDIEQSFWKDGVNNQRHSFLYSVGRSFDRAEIIAEQF